MTTYTLLGLGVGCVVLSTYALAQAPGSTVLARSSRGFVAFQGNELSVLSTIEDPSAVRVGSTAGGSFGKLSGGRVRSDGTELEKVLVQFKEDEDFPGQLGGQFQVNLQRPATDDDKNMLRVLTLTSRRAQFHVPVLDSYGNTIGGTKPSDTMMSANGRYHVIMQGDGNLVVYDTMTGKPIWSWMTGKL